MLARVGLRRPSGMAFVEMAVALGQMACGRSMAHRKVPQL